MESITLKMPGTGILSVNTDFVNKSLQSFGHITKLPRRPLLQVTVSSEPAPAALSLFLPTRRNGEG
jgi:hypothetical protein